ncbi:hypothetical protein ACHAXH_006660 [Discostella pseudostelligera]
MRSFLFTATLLLGPTTPVAGFAPSPFHGVGGSISVNICLVNHDARITTSYVSSSSTTTTTSSSRAATTSSTRLYSAPEPLAVEGDWSAYLDSESTGYIYYFNTVTGESTWEKPTPTFPTVTASASSASSSTATTKEDRRAERQRKREQRKKEMEMSGGGGGGGGGGLFGGFFGGGGSGGDSKSDAKDSAPSKTEQLSNLRSIASNTEFLTELDSVIAEAEEAIAIAEKVTTAPPKNKGGFFSSLGFISGMEAVEEAETLISDAEERTSKAFEDIFSGFGFGGGSSTKTAASTATASSTTSSKPSDAKATSTTTSSSSSTPVAEENIWVEGLKNLFMNAFDSFIPPPVTTISTGKKIAIDDIPSTASSTAATTTTSPKKELTKKAEVSDSDFLDVIWGAETSARPTLNIAEMMKAFKLRSVEEETTTTTTVVGEEFKTLTLDAALQVKAHPEKVSWGGEDAGFIVGRTFGVFDGVSGATKEKGKKLYSRSLADSMKKSTSTATSAGEGLTVKQITDSLTSAKELADEEATGASTAVVASIGSDNILRALNLGDSVCLVLRDGAVAARTREIIHYFDCPYQLGDDSPDRPRDGTTLQAEIFKGDIIVAGSDGVFDNLSDADVCDIVSGLGPKSKSVVIAKTIVDKSRTVSLDPMSVTPYSTVARGKSGYSAYKNGRGGKIDDISCIVVKAS